MRHQTWIKLAMVFALLAGSLTAHAGDDEEVSNLTEARLEGQIWTTFALNQHLNPFDLKVDVDSKTAIIEGEVDESVKSELAEQIALSVDGIDDVDNRIEVSENMQVVSSSDDKEKDPSFRDRVSDATTTASVKSKLLWNRDTAGLSINVNTRGGIVELEGEAESEASKDLAERLAANTDGVRDVINNIEVVSRQQAQADTDH